MKRLFFLKGGLFQTLSCISLFLIMFLNANNLKACHALPIVSAGVTTVANGGHCACEFTVKQEDL